VEGRQFLHPDLRLGFTAPEGFGMMNAPTAVSINGSSGQAQFTTLPGTYGGDLDAYVRQVFQALTSGGNNGQQQAAPPTLGDVRRTQVNGIPAAFASARANTQQGQVEVTLFAYEFDRQHAYHFVTLTQVGGGAVFEGMFNSVRRLTAREATAIRPRRIDVVTVRRGDTQDSLARQMAYGDNQLTRFQVLNGLTAGSPLTPGQRIKLVIYAAS
jgi:predicted Zn-dependent protease